MARRRRGACDEETCLRGEAQVPLWRQRWLAAANPSKWPKARSNDHDPCGSRTTTDFHDPCGSPNPPEPTRTHPSRGGFSRARLTGAHPWAKGSCLRGRSSPQGCCGTGRGCRMDRDSQRLCGCRMDRGRYCGSSTTLTDSRLPTSVACCGEPALPPHFKSPRSSSSKFPPCAAIGSDNRRGRGCRGANTA